MESFGVMRDDVDEMYYVVGMTADGSAVMQGGYVFLENAREVRDDLAAGRRAPRG